MSRKRVDTDTDAAAKPPAITYLVCSWCAAKMPVDHYESHICDYRKWNGQERWRHASGLEAMGRLSERQKHDLVAAASQPRSSSSCPDEVQMQF